MDILVLKRALEREKARRSQAEQLLETKSRDLFLSYEKLSESHRNLEQINLELDAKKKQLKDLNYLHDTVTSDLKLAANLQKQIIPNAKRIGDFEAHGISKPAMYVAGDLYDYFQLSDETLAFYMADVTGHGSAAAMVSYAIHMQLNPKSNGICASNYLSCSSMEAMVMNTVAELNMEYALLEGDAHYFTLVFGLVNMQTGEVCFCQAGHPPPIHFSSSDNKVKTLGDGGMPMGMFPDVSYSAVTCNLADGDSLLIYSDGIVECFSPEGEAFGNERLLNTLQDTGSDNSKSVLKKLEDEIIQWNGSDVFNDDVSVLVLKRHQTTDSSVPPSQQ